jgi:hypothetical protein
MMIDILGLLRSVPDCKCHAVCSWECGCDAIWPEDYVKDAANEIERLRKELAVSESFYRVALAERNAAWNECEELRATIERIKHPPRTEHNRYSDIVSDGGMDPRDQPFDPPKVDIVVQAADLED